MEIFLIFLVIVVLTALAIGWIAVMAISLVLRLCFRVVALPFRVAGRCDRAIAKRFTASAPRRVLREDDVQCPIRLCSARLSADAKFCARCGTALAIRRASVPGLVVEARSRGLSQVA